MTNTSRTLNYLREKGYDADIVERFLSHAGKRKDLFGFIDIVAIGEGKIIAVQSCGQTFKEHDRKITEDPEVVEKAIRWLESGGRIMLVGWRKIKIKRGGKALRWKPRIKEYSIKDFRMEVTDVQTNG